MFIDNANRDLLNADGVIISVSELNQQVRYLLEGSFSLVWVTGEISNLRYIASSGHWYFSLKDAKAQIRCAFFRMQASKLKFQPKEGMHVLAHAQVSLYEERGEFQLIIHQLEPAGDGALRQAFEALKMRLESEGLFASTHKKTLPRLPRCIGIITSPSGAALHDIVSVLKRRFASIPIIIYPTPVQGSEAPAKISRALSLANNRLECDVLILARGGGSLEDLWCFNDERVARAIYQSVIPIISAIGHEIDFTIADFVADQRAPTPSVAAELATPDASAWLETFARVYLRLNRAITSLLKHQNLILDSLGKRLPHPQRRLQQQAQRLDDLQQQLFRAHLYVMRHNQALIERLYVKLSYHSPQQAIRVGMTENSALKQRLLTASQYLLQQNYQKLDELMRALAGVSPLNTLQRGYAIALQDNRVVSSAEQVQVGEKIKVKLAQGELGCLVVTQLLG